MKFLRPRIFLSLLSPFLLLASHAFIPLIFITQLVFAASVVQANQVRVSGSLVFPVLKSNEKDHSMIRLAEREMYIRDVVTGDVLGKTLTQLDGKFQFFVKNPGRYEVCWHLDYLGNGCSRPFSVKKEEVILGNQIVDSKSAYLYGSSLMADTRPCWFQDAFFKVNSFTRVVLVDPTGIDAANPVTANVAGEYVMGFPDKKRYRLSARCEKSEYLTRTYHSAGTPQKVDLPLKNHAPTKIELAAFLNDRGVTRAHTSATLLTRFIANDKDGHNLAYEWKLLDSAGVISGTFAKEEKWELPGTPGSYAIYVMASDNHGGYVVATLPMQVGVPFVFFSGRVIDEVTGTPVADAEVKMLDQKMHTNNEGWFSFKVAELVGEQRYPLTINRFDYATYARVLDKSSRGNTYALIQAQVTQHDPDLPIEVIDTGSSGPCGLGNTQRITNKMNSRLREKTAQLRFAERDCKNRGAGLRIPAGALVYDDQSPAAGPVSMAMATINPARRAMVGDYRAQSRDIGEAELISFGALYAEFRDKNGKKINLKQDASAELTIPVAADQQALANPAIDMWSYNEKTGYWDQEGQAVLQNTAIGLAYVGKTTHFSTINMDVAGNDPAGATCVRLELGASLTSQNWSSLVLRSYVTYGGNFSQVKEVALDNAQYHAIYRIPYNNPTANNTLRLELRGLLPGGSEVVLLNNVINTDLRPKMTGVDLWPPYPYTECGDPIVLEADPVNLPYYGDINSTGRPAFLTGINGGYLPEDGFAASAAYYVAVDPLNLKGDLGAWWDENGFDAMTGAGGTRASYLNHNDLGFGRDMHCVGDAVDYACYVTNYGLPDQNLTNADDAESQNPATQGATVAMEYHSAEGASAVSFYAFGGGTATSGRIQFADLDGLGPKPIPQLCTVCHGGYVNDGTQKVDGAFFREFDLPSFKYPGGISWDHAPSPLFGNLSNAVLGNFRTLNTEVGAFNGGNEIGNLIAAWYATPAPAPQQLTNAQVAAQGWSGDEDMYRDLYGPTCRTCHLARPGSLDTYADLQSSHFYVCGNPKVMPNAYITYKNFWSDLIRVDLYRTATGQATCGQ